MISVLGGVVLILGTFLIFFGSGSTSSGSAVKQRAADQAVRGGTAPASIASPGAESSDTPTPGPSATPATQRSFSAAPPFTLDPSAGYTATLKTEKGDIVIKLDAKAAPQAANDFVFLAKGGFYDGLSFQRVVPDFVAQAGAPNSDGTGGPGYTIPDENSPLKHDTGSVALAQTGTSGNSGGSQFYVALTPFPSQDGKDTVFGQVTSGLDILKQLPKRDPKDTNPAPALKIDSVTISKQ